ncbi:protein kinase [Mycobacterium sp. IS-1742]|uniref:serine/threonine-protein kinase n=1 Tax=Mycobacterium sp. IS-1742 TaxID=1772285 RepID=UPI0007404449|nr:protein kinase [Mycobacterium sp. IS-1742]
MPLGDGTKIAGYTIQRMLGSGGMGEVYLAQHPRLPRQDALKVLKADISADADFLERFHREADLAAKLWHPHIVGIHDRGRYRGRLWISMDFVDGTDVGRLLQQKYPNGMPAEDALEIVTAVASALDYAHSRGLLHRDVKPANILVADVDNGERRILLGDFGVARDLADDTSGGLTATNMTVGTAAYAAPEQLMGLDVDGRTDQYSLAVTAYHMLTGAPPFRNSKAAVVIGQHLNATPPRLADTHPELAPLDAAMARALAKDPDERFATCMDFARALEAPENGEPPPALGEAETMVRSAAPPPAAPAQPAAPVPRRRAGGWLAAAAVVLVAVAAVLGYLVFAPGDEKPAPEPFTLAGTLRLPDEVMKTSGLPGGYTCAGTKTYGDIGPNAPVIVEDEAGKLLAKGAIHGSDSEREGCSLSFRVPEVPTGAKFYRVQVAHSAEANYTEAEAKAGVEVEVGPVEPEPSPSPSQSPSQSPSTVTKTLPPPPPVTPDVEQRSLSQLQTIARNDRPYVSLYLTDRWLPQLSAKRVGLEAEGTVWDNEQILAEHLAIREEYPGARLLWSGDWSTYDSRNFWITIVGWTSTDPGEILSWCTYEGYDRDHCIAKIVSTSRGPDDTTKTNP